MVTGTDSIQRIHYDITALKYLLYLANEMLIKIMSLYHIYNFQQSNCLFFFIKIIDYNNGDFMTSFVSS